MRKPSLGITPEGGPSIFLAALSAEAFAFLGCWPLAVLFLLLTAFCCYFFRDPERVVPHQPGLAVSPADGKVVRLEIRPDPYTGKPRQCICIFMNVFSVHVNRSPVAATVTDIAYHEGKYLNAALDKASRDNERCAYQLTEADGAEWRMVQVSGLIARRIVCRVDIGDALARGQRYGMIKFGSRVDLYLPEEYAAEVRVGQQVFAGQTVVASRK